MQNQKPTVVFDNKEASSYNDQFTKLVPIRNTLNLLIQMILSDLPANARILCVGVGTGKELLYLAQVFPKWQFTAVEPAAPMLDICHQLVDECGIASRCTFHEGYLDSLPESELFDAATCILVSHFLKPIEKRQKFFRQIAARLRPDGYLVNADISSDVTTTAYKNLFDLWVHTLKYSGMPDEQVEKFSAALGKDVAVLPPQEIESIISSNGFDTPVLFLQTLFIHAWYARRVS